MSVQPRNGVVVPAAVVPPKKGGSLQSFPVPSAAEDEEEDDVAEVIEEEIHKGEDVSIKVTQSPGFLCHIEATAAFRLPARTLYKQVITHPDNAAIFRHMDRCSYRRVLEDDGQGRRRVRVAHEASWRFLMFHGTFTTKLLVDEDEDKMIMDFQLDPEGGAGGIMKRFHGRWTIRPHPADPLHASLSTLDQDLALGIYMPPPLDRFLKRISCNQVRNIFADVKREADKVNKGKPTLRPWEEVKDAAIGEDQDAEAAGQASMGPEAKQQLLAAAKAALATPAAAPAVPLAPAGQQADGAVAGMLPQR